MKKKYKDRAEALKLKKKEKILAIKREKEEDQEKQLKKINSHFSLGVRVWLSEEEDKTEILVVNEEKRKAALQARLAFFRNILNITYSASGKSYLGTLLQF